MELPKRENIKIIQGAKFERSWHWYGGGKVQDEIANIAVGHPTVITVPSHGLPSISDTPISIDGIKGTARVLNIGLDECDMVAAKYIDSDTFSVGIPTVGKVYSTGTGYIEWYLPKDLTDYTARMQIREDITSTTPLVSLTSGAGEITISIPDARITVIISTATTETLDFDSGVYDLELIDSSGEATRLLEGDVLLSSEVTRS